MSKKNDLALQSAMRTIMGSQGLKAMRTIMDSPGLKAMREFMDSPASKVMHNPVDMPTQRAMRTIIDSPGLGATYEAALVNQRAMLEAARVNQWMSRLGDTNNNMLLAQMPKASAILEQNERIRYVTASMASTLAGVDHPRLSGILDLNAHLSDATEATRLKLAMLAGAGDVLGFESRTSFAAHEELFGRWHTRPDLPQRFWRDPATRRRHYNEAEVDPGLIEMAPAGAVDVVIDSGFSAGVSEGENSISLIEIPSLVMQIRSTNPSGDAFRAVVAFERALRHFITLKLEAIAGPRWFKQRVNGKDHQKARENRAAAMANGEADKALIAYLDLGDLLTILLRTDNWDGVFGNIFPNRERLRFDFETLIATRRPTMHARKIDAVRLVELVYIIKRLTRWIEDDGDWKATAESED